MAAVRGWIFTIYFILTANAVWGHIPYYYSAEPDAPIYVSGVPGTKMSSETAADRLRAVRAVMEAMRVDAYIVPTADAHNSQYISPADARREWLSGLRGSSGTALVTATEALVWTDARYWTQFEEEVDGTLWKLMKQGVDASLQQWLVSNMPPNSVVAVDPTTYTRRAWTSLDNDLSAAGVDLLAIYDNLVDEARRQLISQMQQKNADMLLLTALDDIAYTLNLRGTDIPYNPVFFSYLLIRRHPNIGSTVAEIVLFWGDGVLPENIRNHLTVEGVPVFSRPYEDIFDYLRSVSSGIGAQSTIWLSNEASHAIWLAIESGGSAHVYSTSISPVALKKCVKNDVELEGFRLAHIKDGLAVVRALEDNFRGPSFSTIAGAGMRARQI
ncbi:hypothetical protein SFRURICE_014283 [Spodoptera frugiperda]|nr:hypothetical protein SFRURICE_014283 [Spodoptera frugiperda]